MPDKNLNIPFQPHPHSHRFIDLTGHIYGRLTVLGYVGLRNGRSHWLCQCACGNRTIKRANLMRRGETASCGCLEKEHHHWLKHPQAVGCRTPEYTAFQNAKRRCTDANRPEWPAYGGRGIEFRFKSFGEFFAELGRRPSDQHSIDRIDNDGHYEAGNVRWSTRKQQNQNTRQNTLVTLDGITKPITEWCKVLGVSKSTVYYRIKHNNMSAVNALLQSSSQHNPSGK